MSISILFELVNALWFIANTFLVTESFCSMTTKLKMIVEKKTPIIADPYFDVLCMQSHYNSKSQSRHCYLIVYLSIMMSIFCPLMVLIERSPLGGRLLFILHITHTTKIYPGLVK